MTPADRRASRQLWDGVRTGTFEHDHNGAAPMAATAGGAHWEHTVRGTITGHYWTSAGQISFTGVTAQGTWTLTRNGTLNNSGQLEASLESVRYSCSAEQLYVQASFYNITLARTTTAP